jgi:carbonic anhydrase
MTQIPLDLHAGYGRFRQGRFEAEAQRYRQLSEGQSPGTMVIGCADSRVDPATIFAAAPGELFVVRNVAALVPPYETEGAYHGTSAALEFAVTQLKVERILVLGHGACGGVTAALTSEGDGQTGRFIGPWVGQLSSLRDMVLEPSRQIEPHQRQQALEYLAVKYSLENLSSFPFVADAMARQELALHGAWFSIGEGALYWLDEQTGQFGEVEAETI